MTIESLHFVPSKMDEGRADWLRGAKKIAIFRALQLGDLLCVVPALRALRLAAPDAEITLIGLPWAESFVQRFSCYIDAFISFPGFPGLPEKSPELAQLPSFLERVQGERFDVAIQMHGSGALTNPLTTTFGAQLVGGFFTPGQMCLDRDRFLAWHEDEHEILRYLDLMEFFGIETHGATLEFPLLDADFERLRQAAPRLSQPGNYVCIHPGAQLPSRRWLPDRFAAVADRLHALGLDVVLTGTQGERDITHAVLRAMRAPALDLTGKTDLGALAALVAQARLVVCNDTGVSHVATAVATPSVVIASGSAPGRWAPLNRIRHRVLCADVPCRPCMVKTCEIGHPCATKITADNVTDEALQILSSTPSLWPQSPTSADEPVERRRSTRPVRSAATL